MEMGWLVVLVFFRTTPGQLSAQVGPDAIDNEFIF